MDLTNQQYIKYINSYLYLSLMHLNLLKNGSCHSKRVGEAANLIIYFPFSCTCQEHWTLL